jgi:hypothetical protein
LALLALPGAAGGPPCAQLRTGRVIQYSRGSSD